MKNKIRTLPVPLQDLLIYRVALAILALGTSLALAIFLHDVHFALPGLILCVTMLISAIPALDARPIPGAARNRSACGADHDPKTYKGHYSGS